LKKISLLLERGAIILFEMKQLAGFRAEEGCDMICSENLAMG
jgi:hypothetical protein